MAPNHLISADPAEFPAHPGLEDLAGRSMLVRKADMLAIECIVRGYLAGSAYKEYDASGTVHGMPMPSGLASRPTARADVHPLDQGHRGPRPEHRHGRGGRPGRRRGGRRGPRSVPGRLPSGLRPGPRSAAS